MIESTSITIENNYGTYKITHHQIDMCITDYVDDLIIPVLLAAGFNRECIDGIFNNE